MSTSISVPDRNSSYLFSKNTITPEYYKKLQQPRNINPKSTILIISQNAKLKSSCKFVLIVSSGTINTKCPVLLLPRLLLRNVA